MKRIKISIKEDNEKIDSLTLNADNILPLTLGNSVLYDFNKYAPLLIPKKTLKRLEKHIEINSAKKKICGLE